MTSGVELAFAVLVSLASFLVLVGVLWLVAVPLCGAGPVEVKTVYSHLARSCKKKKKWSYTRIEGTQMYLGAVPRSVEHLQELHGRVVVVSDFEVAARDHFADVLDDNFHQRADAIRRHLLV